MCNLCAGIKERAGSAALGASMKWLLIFAAASVSLGGCATSHFNYRKAGAAINGPPLSDSALAKGFLATADTPAERREMVFALARESDVRCENYLVGVSAVSNEVRSTLDIGGLALGTAGALATPERSANLLSGLATFTGNSRNALSQTVFGGRDFPIIYAAIRNGRRSQRDTLFDAANRGTFDDWGPQSILAYLTGYDLDCGVNYGLQQIANAVDRAGEEGRRELVTPGESDADSREQIAPPSPP